MAERVLVPNCSVSGVGSLLIPRERWKGVFLGLDESTEQEEASPQEGHWQDCPHPRWPLILLPSLKWKLQSSDVLSVCHVSRTASPVFEAEDRKWMLWVKSPFPRTLKTFFLGGSLSTGSTNSSLGSRKLQVTNFQWAVGSLPSSLTAGSCLLWLSCKSRHILLLFWNRKQVDERWTFKACYKSGDFLSPPKH